MEVMMNKRLTVDLGMLISFLVLLDYRLVRNFGHETLALVFFFLFFFTPGLTGSGMLPLPGADGTRTGN